MKRFKYNTFFIAAIFLVATLSACEQEKAIVELNAAPDGGTVTTYKAYELFGVTEDDVYGRVVFYKDNSGSTLVQVGLYNTEEGVEYETGVFSGANGAETSAELMPFYPVDGATGAFSTSKFYVISDKTFFDALPDFDAHFKLIKAGELVSVGNIGLNADPVAEAE
jgi:hypothetical protein